MKGAWTRENEGERKKEWVDSPVKWEYIERKEVDVLKREERLDGMNMHMLKASAFEVLDGRITCSEAWQSLFIDRELKSVSFFATQSFVCIMVLLLCREFIDCLSIFFFSILSLICWLFLMDGCYNMQKYPRNTSSV